MVPRRRPILHMIRGVLVLILKEVWATAVLFLFLMTVVEKLDATATRDVLLIYGQKSGRHSHGSDAKRQRLSGPMNANSRTPIGGASLYLHRRHLPAAREHPVRRRTAATPAARPLARPGDPTMIRTERVARAPVLHHLHRLLRGFLHRYWLRQLRYQRGRSRPDDIWYSEQQFVTMIMDLRMHGLIRLSSR